MIVGEMIVDEIIWTLFLLHAICFIELILLFVRRRFTKYGTILTYIVYSMDFLNCSYLKFAL